MIIGTETGAGGSGSNRRLRAGNLAHCQSYATPAWNPL